MASGQGPSSLLTRVPPLPRVHLTRPRPRVLLYLSHELCRVARHAQFGNLPLHLAARGNTSEAVIKALLEAHPEGAKEKNHVRGQRAGSLFSAHTRGPLASRAPHPPPPLRAAVSQFSHVLCRVARHA